MLTFAQQKEIARWYALKPIAEQQRFQACVKRFRIIDAGRRSGKTELSKRYVVEQAMAIPGLYGISAPTIAQVKKIYWKDIVNMSFRSVQKSRPNKSDLIIPFDNSSEIHLFGMENPKRVEGIPWKGFLCDEFSYYKEEAWSESIRPSLSTEDPENPGYKPWCIIISKPNGLNHFYDLYRYALTNKDPDWESFHWFSSAVLSEEEVAAARRTMSPRQFRQEYEASFETVTGRIYEDYNQLNFTYEKIRDDEEINYFCDFNYTPMSHGIAVIRNQWIDQGNNQGYNKENVLVLDEIVLTSAKGWHNAKEFCERYKDHKNKNLKLYGDRSGRNGEKHGLETEYLLMEEVFEANGWEVQRCVKDANPAIKDRHNCVNAKICNANGERSLFVDPVNAPYCDKGLSTVVLRKGSTYMEDDTNPYQHITTGLGYFCDHRFPIEGNYDLDKINSSIRMWGL
jgi:hypothetical protein